MGSDAAAMQAKFPSAGAGIRGMLKAESPQIPVNVDSFYIDKYEVTNEQFLNFTKEHPEYASRTWSGGAEDPVTHVTWYAAKAYCAWQYKRLPTEADGSTRARGGASSAEYPWGAGPPDPAESEFRSVKDRISRACWQFPAERIWTL